MTDTRKYDVFSITVDAIGAAKRARRSALRTIMREYERGNIDIDDVALFAGAIEHTSPVSTATAYRRLNEWRGELDRDEAVNGRHQHLWGCMGHDERFLSCMCGEPGAWITDEEAEAIFG